jgi:Flp pilus assembly pilin Flp
MEQSKLRTGKQQLKKKSLGQGMVEYIIIVAVVALGSIAVYTAFGDVLRGQVATAAGALDGNPSTEGRASSAAAVENANSTEALNKTLGTYETIASGGGGSEGGAASGE